MPPGCFMMLMLYVNCDKVTLTIELALCKCRLRTVFAPNMHTVAALQRKARATTAHTSINQLASSFVAALQVCYPKSVGKCTCVSSSSGVRRHCAGPRGDLFPMQHASARSVVSDIYHLTLPHVQCSSCLEWCRETTAPGRARLLARP